MANVKSNTAAPEAPAVGLAAFRAEHDRSVIVPTRIRAAFKRMLEEHPEKWLYEEPFRREAKLANTDMAAARVAFAEHIVVTPGGDGKRVWFADAKVAAKARECLK